MSRNGEDLIGLFMDTDQDALHQHARVQGKIPVPVHNGAPPQLWSERDTTLTFLDDPHPNLTDER